MFNGDSSRLGYMAVVLCGSHSGMIPRGILIFKQLLSFFSFVSVLLALGGLELGPYITLLPYKQHCYKEANINLSVASPLWYSGSTIKGVAMKSSTDFHGSQRTYLNYLWKTPNFLSSTNIRLTAVVLHEEISQQLLDGSP